MVKKVIGISMDTVVVVDMDITVSFYDVRFSVNGGTVAIKSGKPFLDDHVSCDGLQYIGFIKRDHAEAFTLNDADHPDRIGRVWYTDHLCLLGRCSKATQEQKKEKEFADGKCRSQWLVFISSDNYRK